MKLALGTVQFGLDYGAFNQSGQVTPEQAREILDLAGAAGIDTLDTASLYGNSEKLLGSILSTTDHFRIITKSAQFQADIAPDKRPPLLRQQFEQSLINLRTDHVDGFMIHRADNLIEAGGDSLYQTLKELKSAGLIRKIGVSVYSADQIDAILERFDIELIQIPINVLDQRLLHSGHLDKLKDRSIEIHARSIFLQGLLLRPAEDLPDYFSPIRPTLQRYQNALRKYSLSLQAGAMSFIKELPQIGRIVIGVENAQQLKENLCAYKQGQSSKFLNEFNYRDYSCDDPAMLNPGQWSIDPA